MAQKGKPNWYWPLGALSYASEIHEFVPEEAELIGVITILWNRQELSLKQLFALFLSHNKSECAYAIWDRQPTHQARRNLLAIAVNLEAGSERGKHLDWIVEHTKTLADRRNELIHAEYVMHGRTSVLHARVKSPNSKVEKYQKSSVEDLQTVVADIEHLLSVTEGLITDFIVSDEALALTSSVSDTRGSCDPHTENSQTDYRPLSARQTRASKPGTRPRSKRK